MKSLADDYKEHLDSMGGEPDGEDGEGDDHEEGLHDAAKMVMAAMKKGDAEAFAEAMCTMFPLLKKYNDEYGDGGDDGEPPSGGHAALLLMPHHGGG
jgi:hypothetical protein